MAAPDDTTAEHDPMYADVVLEGGGVKGIALAGAAVRLAERGYRFRRIAGSSAGAAIACGLAVGLDTSEYSKFLINFDYPSLRDESWMARLGLPGKAASLLLEKGLYQGKALESWVEDGLKEHGVKTFGDLKLTEDWARDLPPSQRYKLVVTASDVTRGRLIRLPWDYHKYGLDPDRQSVAKAVRMSMSIPFFYTPRRMRRNYIVDGGLLSNFPVEIFDRPLGQLPRWPTFGLKLSPMAQPDARRHKISNFFDYAKAVFGTMTEYSEWVHSDNPCLIDRTIYIDTNMVRATDFDLSLRQRRDLFKRGEAAAEDFLQGWDFADYVHRCRLGTLQRVR